MIFLLYIAFPPPTPAPQVFNYILFYYFNSLDNYKLIYNFILKFCI